MRILLSVLLFTALGCYAESKPAFEEPSFKTAKDLYFDVMKRALTNWIYGAFEKPPMKPRLRFEGRDNAPTAYTVIGMTRLNNLQFCVEDVLKNNIPGDLIECGAWRGGATIFMRAILKAYSVTDRKVFVADSFEGMPETNPAKYPMDKGMEKSSSLYSDYFKVSLEQVKANFASFDLLDSQVVFLKGWFKETLPTAPIQKLAVLRVDADLYESTMDSLVNLYPKLAVGGYLIVDDFGCYPACSQAVLDYRQAHGIKEAIVGIDWTGVYWKKTK